MITKIDINNDSVVGRLGNKMFQIAAGWSMAKQIGMDFMIPNWKYAYVFPNVKIGTISTYTESYTEPSFTYTKPPLEYFHGVIQLNGYFQSDKYFTSKEDIQELFKFSEYCKSKSIQWEEDQKIKLSDYTSIHIRRGDYVNLPNYYADLPTSDYYKNAIEQSGNKKFLIFSDDVSFCLDYFSEFSGYEFRFAAGNSESSDLHLMTMCKSNIIANSSFSWWGAYLNKNTEKVIAPKNWFTCDLSSKDLYVNDWTVI
jgi:hypothetical protein